MTTANRIISLISKLNYSGPPLPDEIRVMNPYRDHPQVMSIVKDFYKKFYDDHRRRILILGINPGRFGAAMTGIPFTDPKRLSLVCDIPYHGKMTHEPSSTFVYNMITAYGGPASFYGDFYINSICPLGLVARGNNGKEKNYNYYDDPVVLSLLTDFIIDNIKKQIGLGMRTDICFCFGTGKNEKVLRDINGKYGFFAKVIALEHPRFIVQYKNKDRAKYIQKYLQAFESALKTG